jgi:UDP-3-O-[3-hydroxymyristoyl] glucosamine N-acyltransferase
MPESTFSLSDIANIIGAQLRGEGNCQIKGIAPLYRAQQGEISFITNSQFRNYLSTSQASAVIMSAEEAKHCKINALIMDNPYLGFAKSAELFQPKLTIQHEIHNTVVIGEDCKINSKVSIGPYCVIGSQVEIDENTVVGAGCIIGDGVKIGKNCRLFPHATLYNNIKLGNRVWLHSGTVIGSDGFGLANDKGQWHKIPQLGSVIIGDDVEIGANTTVDRGALDDTIIENGVKLDNLIQVAHNVSIGEHTAIAACTGIAGSARIGKRCMIGGGASIVGHIEIVDDVILVGTATVEKSITVPGIYGSGTGLLPFRELKKVVVRIRQLDDIVRRLQQLERNEK